jgi:cell division protease FtsH
MKKIESPEKNKKPLYYYYFISILIIFFLNWVIFPMILQINVHEVPYSEFLQKVDSGRVENVEIQQNQILFTETSDNGTDAIYKTGIIDDPELVKRLEEKKINFGAVIPKRPNFFLQLLLSYGMPLLFFMGIGRLISRNMKQSAGKFGLSLGSGDSAKLYIPSEESISFDEVAGQEEAKESLIEVIDFLKNPEKYKDVGAKCPKGILLVGPPGTGKTLIARAVAGEANVPFFSISGSEFVEMFVGRGAAKVRDLFDQANKKAPCIVFIDEIDTIGKRRDSGISTNDEREQTLNQLLTEMDGFSSGNGVIILAATNRPEVLDPALLRPGRFDRQVRMELPDLQGRVDILKVHAKNYKMEGNIDYNLIARATAGASGADLANILNEAALRAVRLNKSEISQCDLEESIEVVIAGAQKKNAIMNEDEKKIVAYHEIGHALVAAKQTNSAPVHKITIVPRTSGALGYTMQVDVEDKVLITKADALNRITTLCGGRAAEEVVFNEITTGAANDIEQATKLARNMVVKYGMTEEFGMMALESGGNRYLGERGYATYSADTGRRVDEAVLSIIKECQQNARDLLKANEPKLHQLADYLIEKETITGEEFMTILNAD